MGNSYLPPPWIDANNVILNPTAASPQPLPQALAALAPIAQTFGIGQTFTNVTGSRVAGTLYTNSTGKPIAVYVTANSSAVGGFIQVSVNSVVVASVVSPQTIAGIGPGSIIVPAGATYQVNVGSATLAIWYELR